MFKLVALGTSGGPYDTNLTSFLVGFEEEPKYLIFDAGSVLSGLKQAFTKGSLSLQKPFDLKDEIAFLQQEVLAYVITHAHLDHLASLVLNSPVDTPKKIYSTQETLTSIKTHLFNGKIWTDFSQSSSSRPQLYQYSEVGFGKKTLIEGSNFSIEPFALNHFHLECVSYLLEIQDHYLMFFGDTGPDHEKKRLEPIKAQLIPLLKQKKLKGLVIECAYHTYPEGKEELKRAHFDVASLLFFLRSIFDEAGSSCPVVVIHRKVSTLKQVDADKQIHEALQMQGSELKWIFPQQGDLINLS